MDFVILYSFCSDKKHEFIVKRAVATIRDTDVMPAVCFFLSCFFFFCEGGLMC